MGAHQHTTVKRHKRPIICHCSERFGKTWGRGVEIEHGGSVGYDWIPASAGMTEEGARDSSLPKVWRVCFTFTSTSARVCRGAKPLCRGFGGVPQTTQSPPQEWGIKGVEREHVEVPAGFVSLYPSYNWLRQR
jgi:hypothetical protein